jgi:hypothetical protein
MSDESKPDESKIGTVLANAPAIKKAFGPYLGALIILVSVYFARPKLGIFRFFVLALIALPQQYKVGSITRLDETHSRRTRYRPS